MLAGKLAGVERRGGAAKTLPISIPSRPPHRNATAIHETGGEGKVPPRPASVPPRASPLHSQQIEKGCDRERQRPRNPLRCFEHRHELVFAQWCLIGMYDHMTEAA